MKIYYDKVSYLGNEKVNLHFVNLIVDSIKYGDLVISIKTELGSKLNNYCLKNENNLIPIEIVGNDLDLIELSTEDIIKAVFNSVFDWFDQQARTQNFISSNDCISYLNSSDTLKAKNAKIFSEWRDKNLSIFNEIIENVPDNFSIDYVLERFIPIEWAKSDDEKTLDELKSEKLAELTAITSRFDNQLVNNEMIIKSSLGFAVNADLRSQNNLRGLIAVGIEPVNFMTSDNNVKSLTLEQLNTLLNECALNGQNLYLQKWHYREQIENAKTKEELNSIEFKFSMHDFSKKEVVTDE